MNEKSTEIWEMLVPNAQMRATAVHDISLLRSQARESRQATIGSVRQVLEQDSMSRVEIKSLGLHRIIVRSIGLACAAFVFLVGIGLLMNLPDSNRRTYSFAALNQVRITDSSALSPSAVSKSYNVALHGSLFESISRIPRGGELEILAGSTSETLSISKPVRLVAVGGHVVIGKVN